VKCKEEVKIRTSSRRAASKQRRRSFLPPAQADAVMRPANAKHGEICTIFCTIPRLVQGFMQLGPVGAFRPRSQEVTARGLQEERCSVLRLAVNILDEVPSR
jgi:hypothetical protein